MRSSPVGMSQEAQAETALRHAEIITELQALREALCAQEKLQAAAAITQENSAFQKQLATIYDAVQNTKQEIATLVLTSFNNPEMGRVTQELNAVRGGTETAAHRIMQAGEEIEDAARTLAAAIHGVQDQNLARDILDQVTTIFEACNFQDVAGQRLTKVTETLKFIEEHILRLKDIWGGMEKLAGVEAVAQAEIDEAKLLNGPRLESDHGCMSQKEIDAVFAAHGSR